MNVVKKRCVAEHYYIRGSSTFPNNPRLPVLLYKNALELPRLLPAAYLKKLFREHGWSNAWKNGILGVDHYHSICHEVLGVYRGETRVLLGGEKGLELTLQKGDVLILPAGVAHKNLEPEAVFHCVGAYPGGAEYDMNYGKAGERPQTDMNIKKVPLPEEDPVFGKRGGTVKYWTGKSLADAPRKTGLQVRKKRPIL